MSIMLIRGGRKPLNLQLMGERVNSTHIFKHFVYNFSFLHVVFKPGRGIVKRFDRWMRSGQNKEVAWHQLIGWKYRTCIEVMFLGLPMPMEFVPLDGLLAFRAIDH